ncbi:hypothetical protein NMY22_g3558 [Coprinellus aureogranulatus]|nr:hypothetical protein NMY22_g3558 [Coprinellus aureogranulatus]
MNPAYDTDSASAALEKLAQERQGEKLAGVQLADPIVKSIGDWATVVQCSAPTTKRLARSDVDGEDAEVVWHIQGILTNANLPPFRGNLKGRMKDKAKYLRQGVRLCGLDTDTFNRAIANIGNVAAMFSRTVANVLPSTFIDADEQGTHIDYVEVGPVAFKTGDIVEAQVTFMLIPTKDVDWRMIAVLRCLTLLEGKFATDIIRLGIDPQRTIRPSSGAKRPLKRRFGVDLDERDEEDETVSKISRMDLDSNTC